MLSRIRERGRMGHRTEIGHDLGNHQRPCSEIMGAARLPGISGGSMTKRACGLAGFLLALVLVKACQMGGIL